MSSIFYRKKPIIGLDISRTSIKVMSIDRNRMLVHGYGSINLDSQKSDGNSADNTEYLAQNIKTLLKKNVVGQINSNRVALGIPTNRTFSRTFSLPVKEESNIRSAVNLEAEQYIPAPLDSLYLDYRITNRTKDELSVLMCAAPKKMIDSMLDATKQCGLEVAIIEPNISAIARLLKRTEEGMLPTVIVDIGTSTTDIAILDSDIRVTGGLNVGGYSLTLNLAKKMNVPIETAHQFKVLNGLNPGPRQARIAGALHPSLEKMTNEVKRSLEKMTNEVKRVMRYYTDRFPNEKKIEQILIVGGGGNLPGIGDFFTNELLMPARVASPWQMLNFDGLEQPAKQLRSQLSPVAGLALIKQEDIYD